MEEAGSQVGVTLADTMLGVDNGDGQGATLTQSLSQRVTTEPSVIV